MTYPKNDKGIDYVVGDIHGMFSQLQLQLDEMGFNPEKDRLFSVGDLIDRGPESHLFLDWIKKPWFHSVRGNHEQLLISHFAELPHADQNHTMNGGLWYYQLLQLDRELAETMYLECLRMPRFLDIETSSGLVGVVHADTGHVYDWHHFVSAIKARDPNATEAALWSRHRISKQDTKRVRGLKLLYVGHTPVKEVTQLGNVVYIDTGGCFPQQGGKLTILKVGETG
jgi:serine/threonine protein phosphatase 1